MALVYTTMRAHTCEDFHPSPRRGHDPDGILHNSRPMVQRISQPQRRQLRASVYHCQKKCSEDYWYKTFRGEQEASTTAYSPGFKGLNAGGMAAELRHGDDRRTHRDDTSKERRKRVFVSCCQLGFMLQHGVMLESSLLPPDSWQKGRQDHCRPKWKEEKGGMRCRHFLVGLKQLAAASRSDFRRRRSR